MKLKFFVFCPDDKEIVNKVIMAATLAGAGKIGNYSECAFITRGRGHWKSEEGAHPTIGKVGEVSEIDEVKIEMECPMEQARVVVDAIKKVHPYESVVIDFVELRNIV
jgi:hypothetical protein